MTLVDFGLLLFASYLVYKIYKLVKFSDKPMLLSIIAIHLSLFLLFLFCVLDIYGMYASDDDLINTGFGTSLIE
jgi:hypothetical protein